MSAHPADPAARECLERLAAAHRLDIAGAPVRRTSSRFCLSVEHGDYNGTELFGVGTDRFIWIAAKPNASGRIRIVSDNFPTDGLIEFRPGGSPAPGSVADSWARFPFGVDWVLRRAGFPTAVGFDATVCSNIPGGGMSRSASLTINLILTVLDANGIPTPDGMRVVDLSQEVETDYIGSPCGKLDQIMIYFAKAGMGTHYRPADRSIEHVPFGGDPASFRIVSLDTGTVRPGLEKSTYKIRRAECDRLAELCREPFGISCLADVKDDALFAAIAARFGAEHPALLKRLSYIYRAQKRFAEMLAAWRAGDIATVGRILRADGIALRDDYEISGPELESMCDIARTVPGVLGERMLGGGDKGAAGAIAESGSVAPLEHAVRTAYPRSRPALADAFAVHSCAIVDGVAVI